MEALEIVVVNKLTDEQAKATKELEEYVDLEEHPEAAQAVEAGKDAIAEAETVEDVQKALEDAKEAVDAAIAAKEALDNAKADAKAKIDEFVGTLDTTDYTTNMNELLDVLNESSNKLHDATTPEEAAKVADEVIEALKAIKSDSQLLTDAKAEAEAKIDEFVGTLDTTDYTTNMDELLGVLNESSNKLHDATTPEEAAKVADEVIEALKAVKSDSLLLAEDQGVSDLSAYLESQEALKRTVPGSDVDYLSVVADTVQAENDKIRSAETVEAVEEAVEAGKKAVLEALRSQVKYYLDTIYNNGEAYGDMVLTEAKYNAYLSGIENGETFEDIINAYENAERERYSLSEKVSEAVKEYETWQENSSLKHTVPGSDVDYLSTVTASVANGYGTISSGKNAEEVAENLEQAKNNVLAELKEVLLSYVETTYNNGEPFFGKVLTEAKYEFYKGTISAATTVDDAIFEYEYMLNSRYDINETITEYVDKLTDLVEGTALKDVVPGSDMDFAAVPDIQKAIADGYGLINQAKSAEEAEAAYNTAVEKVLAAVKEYTKFLLDEIYNKGLGFDAGEENSRLVLTDEQYEYYTNLLAEATTVDEAIHGYEDAVNNRREITDFNLYSAQKRAKETLATYKDPANYTVNKEAYDAAIKAGNEAIDAATTVEDVQKALEDAKKALDAVLDDEAEAVRTENRRNECVNLLTKYVEESKLKTIIPGGEIDFAAVPQINEEIANGYANINAGTTYDEVTLATRAARDKIVVATKDYVKYLLGVVYNESAAYYDLVLSKEDYDNAINTINAVKEKGVITHTELDQVIDAYLNALGGRADIDSLRESKKSEFEEMYKTALESVVPGTESDQYLNKVEGLTKTIENAEAAIDEATSEGAIDKIIEDAYANLLTTLKAYVQDSLKTLVDSIEIYEYDYNIARDAVNSAEDLQTVVDAFKTAYDKRIKTITSANDLTEALKSFDNVAIASDVAIDDELETLSEDKTVKINAGATMKVTGKLATEHLTIEGDGKVELANGAPADNGLNLVYAIKAGAENVVVSEDAETQNTVVASAGKSLTVELEAEVDFKRDDSIPFHVEGGSLTIKGNGAETAVIKNENTVGSAIQNVNGTLTVEDVKVEGKTGIYVMSPDSTTTLTNVTIESTLYGLTSNEAESDKGIGNVVLNNCTIKSTNNAGLYLPARGHVEINGGTITGWSAILTKGCNLDLVGDVTLKSEGNRYTDALSVHNNGSYMAAADGAVLLIISQGNYAEGETVKINIGDDVVFQQECNKSTFEGAKNYYIEVVGTKTATSSEVAGNLDIHYSKFDANQLDKTAPKGNSVQDLQSIKTYLVDIADECRTSIKINDEEYNENLN